MCVTEREKVTVQHRVCVCVCVTEREKVTVQRCVCDRQRVIVCVTEREKVTVQRRVCVCVCVTDRERQRVTVQRRVCEIDNIQYLKNNNLDPNIKACQHILLHQVMIFKKSIIWLFKQAKAWGKSVQPWRLRWGISPSGTAGAPPRGLSGIGLHEYWCSRSLRGTRSPPESPLPSWSPQTPESKTLYLLKEMKTINNEQKLMNGNKPGASSAGGVMHHT